LFYNTEKFHAGLQRLQYIEVKQMDEQRMKEQKARLQKMHEIGKNMSNIIETMARHDYLSQHKELIVEALNEHKRAFEFRNDEYSIKKVKQIDELVAAVSSAYRR
jgi:DNA repair ATPase RecN